MKQINDTFGGTHAEALNAMEAALALAAKKSEQDIYPYMERTPKTSFIVELHDALVELGYTVKRI